MALTWCLNCTLILSQFFFFSLQSHTSCADHDPLRGDNICWRCEDVHDWPDLCINLSLPPSFHAPLFNFYHQDDDPWDYIHACLMFYLYLTCIVWVLNQNAKMPTTRTRDSGDQFAIGRYLQSLPPPVLWPWFGALTPRCSLPPPLLCHWLRTMISSILLLIIIVTITTMMIIILIIILPS